MPLRVPVRETNRLHLERRARPALVQIATSLHRARIRATARVQVGPHGDPRIRVLVQGRGAVEAGLILRPFMYGFAVKVV